MADRRQEIIGIAATLFAERGINQTTVRMIASQVGILSGSLYHHFASKYDIVDAILHDFSTEVLGQYGAFAQGELTAAEQLRAMARYAMSLTVDHKDAVMIVENDFKELATMDRFSYLVDLDREVQRHWVKMLSRGIKSGEFRTTANPEFCFRFFRDAIAGTMRWFRAGKAKSIEELSDEMTALLLDGLAYRAADDNTPGPASARLSAP